MYYPHNIHFLWSAASMQGQSKVDRSARKLADNVGLEQIDQFPTIEFFKTVPLLSLVQFGHWDEILAEPQPRADLGFSNAIWRYARGVALANTGDVKGAKAELAALVPLKANPKVMVLDGNDYPASALLQIADDLLQGEIALAGNDTKAAVAKFTAAVAGQDLLPYTEPPFWYYPTRQSLGAALMKAGKPAEAQAVYEKDLQQYPHNGWSTSGLIDVLEAQGKKDEAAMHREHFTPMWQFADIAQAHIDDADLIDQPRRAAAIFATSIFCIVIIASNARLASSPPAAIASVSTRGVICQLTPHLSLHQPHSLSCPPLPTMAFQ
jgi:tetratricopeptide (TPR) repeat protein